MTRCSVRPLVLAILATALAITTTSSRATARDAASSDTTATRLGAALRPILDRPTRP